VYFHDTAGSAAAKRRRGRLVVILLLTAFCLHVLNPPEVTILPDPYPPSPRQAPVIEPPDADLRLLTVVTRNGWNPHRIVVTYEEVRTDRRLWATMFFRDWDRMPSPLREQGLTRMLARFRRLIDRPRTWRRMTPADWDRVPQPIRAMAFMNMVARWESCLGVSQRFALPRAQVLSRLRALTMGESWFEHRAIGENPDGSTDMGLAQATTFTRAVLRRHAAAGLTDLRLEDEDYFDPLKSSGVLVYWFALMLEETGGDLDLATAAYNVGSGRARQGGGQEYLDGVRGLEARFMTGRSPSPTWRFLRTRSPDATEALARQTGEPCPLQD
jgi:hypothetical protein